MDRARFDHLQLCGCGPQGAQRFDLSYLASDLVARSFPVNDDRAGLLAMIEVLAVIGVFLGVGDLLGQDNVSTGKMAAEYKALTERTGQAG